MADDQPPPTKQRKLAAKEDFLGVFDMLAKEISDDENVARQPEYAKSGSV